MVTSSGRCHGPGCRETAVVDGGFCGERCQDRWHGQFDVRAAGPVQVVWRDPATPSSLLRGIALAEVTRNVPGMQSALTAAAVSFASLSGAADEVRRQDERLGAAFWPRERADEAIVEARELARTSLMTYKQAVDKVIDDYARAQATEFASANAEFPQVASRPDPTRGWLSRLLARWPGRTP